MSSRMYRVKPPVTGLVLGEWGPRVETFRKTIVFAGSSIGKGTFSPPVRGVDLLKDCLVFLVYKVKSEDETIDVGGRRGTRGRFNTPTPTRLLTRLRSTPPGMTHT